MTVSHTIPEKSVTRALREPLGTSRRSRMISDLYGAGRKQDGTMRSASSAHLRIEPRHGMTVWGSGFAPLPPSLLRPLLTEARLNAVGEG